MEEGMEPAKELLLMFREIKFGACWRNEGGLMVELKWLLDISKVLMEEWRCWKGKGPEN